MEIEKILEQARQRADNLWSELYNYYYKSGEKDLQKFMNLNREYRYLMKYISDCEMALYHLEKELGIRKEGK